MNAPAISLRTLPGPKLGQGELPRRLKLLGWGANDSTKGVVTLDDESAKVFAANQHAIGRGSIYGDIEHETVPGTEAYAASQEPRAIAARSARPVVIPGDGLYVEDVTWTETGNKVAPDYQDVSPALFVDATGRVIGMHSFALTRTGAVHGLTFDAAAVAACSAELGAQMRILSAGVPALTPTLAKTMPENTPAPAPDLAAFNTRISDLETAIKALRDGNTAESLKTLSATVANIETRLAQSATSADETERAALLTAAAKDGKLIPLSADNLKLIPTPVLKELVEKLPKNVVPLSASGQPAGTANELKGLARVAAAINQQIKTK